MQEFLLNPHRPLLHIRSAQGGIDQSNRIKRIVRIIIRHRQWYLIGRRNDGGKAARDLARQSRLLRKTDQPGIGFDHILRRYNRLVIYISDGVSSPKGGFAVTERVPGKAHVGAEVFPVARIPWATHRSSGKIQCGIGEQSPHGVVVLNDGQKFERVGFIRHTWKVPAQTERSRKVGQNLPVILDIEIEFAKPEVSDVACAIHIPGRRACHVKCLAVAVDVTSQRSQQGVRGRQIG